MKNQFREFAIYFAGLLFSAPLLYTGIASNNVWLTMLGTLASFSATLLVWPLAQDLFAKFNQAVKVMEVLEKENLTLPTLLENKSAAQSNFAPQITNDLQFIEPARIESQNTNVAINNDILVGPIEFRKKELNSPKTDLERLEELSLEVPEKYEKVLVISDMGVSLINEQDLQSISANKASLTRFVTKDIFPKIDLLTIPALSEFSNKNAAGELLAVASRHYEKIWIYATTADRVHYETALANNRDGIIETLSERLL